MTRRQFKQQLLGLGAIGFGLAANSYAQTQSTVDKWPIRAIRIISPDAAGSGNDIFAGLISPLLSEALGGAAIVIENKPGAGGRIGVEAAFRSAPDGHALLVGNAGSNGINAAIYKDLPYDLEKDFVPLSLLAVGP
ncbi:MAG: tripartite tricarboxylate transporter substrate-binding protein, partial [Burkholderiales bacterium]|nr:tripartite tricarboxylate transporter substrate-binding protein [Burkholderiales bacterium]